jgi:outer membrane receptor protein involved in Fe transport
MPQFKELAPFYYEDVNFSSFGNPFLKMAENLNIDLRYEHYFSKKEFVALTGFYKKIKNAINRVQVNSAANELSYVNTGDADAAGIELEFRKGLLKSDKKTNASSLDLGVNVSYLYSRQELLDDPDDNLTFLPHNTTAALEGASPWLINSDITYSLQGDRGKSLMTALVLNYYSNRIYSIGAPTGNQHIYEVGIPQLDFISKLGLSEKVSLSLNVRNILNPDYNLTKKIESGQTEIISNFKKGITTSIGFSYKF